RRSELVFVQPQQSATAQLFSSQRPHLLGRRRRRSGGSDRSGGDRGAGDGGALVTMQARVGFTLTELQIAHACVAYVTARLLPDEAATAKILKEGDAVVCRIAVEKKRIRKKQNGDAA